MSGFLIDTNVISELAKPSPARSVVKFMSNLNAPFLSVITVHELTYGIARLPSGSKRQVALHELVSALLSTFGANVLPVDDRIAKSSGTIRAEAAAQGRQVALADALIAATAAVHDLTLATRNTSDFDHLNLTAVDPWSAA